MTKIDIISGFLGAGKTTFIKKLLEEAVSGEKVVLIENEFGQIGIDGGFLKDSGVEIREMNSGCICCSLVGDFGASLSEVLTKYRPQRIIIEPSGVGKLSDVIKAVADVSADMEVELNSAVTIVDAAKCRLYMKNFGEFFNNQIENAGTIVLSRTDITDAPKVQKDVEMLRKINGDAVIITTPLADLCGEQLLEIIEKRDTMLDDLLSEVRENRKHRGHGGGSCDCEHIHGGESCDCEHDHGGGSCDCEHIHGGESCDCGHDHGGEGCGCEHDHGGESCDCGHDHGGESCGCEHDHGDESCGCGHDHGGESCDCGHSHGAESSNHDHNGESGVHEPDQDGVRCGHDHHHHHHADEVFTSWGMETIVPVTYDQLEDVLNTMAATQEFGQVLRAKGMLPTEKPGEWLYFDLVPEQYEIREGKPDYTGKVCVIGTGLEEEELNLVFGRRQI